MKSLYIAGPMTGLQDFNYPAFFEAERQLKEVGWDNVINPARIGNRQLSWRKNMRQAIKALMDCDGMALLPGWGNSTGTLVEIGLASNLGISIAEIWMWIRIGPKNSGGLIMDASNGRIWE